MCVSCVGRPKALSTYSSVHTSVTVFYDTAIAVCVKPITALLRDFNETLSQANIILPVTPQVASRLCGKGERGAGGAADVVIRPLSKTLERPDKGETLLRIWKRQR